MRIPHRQAKLSARVAARLLALAGVLGAAWLLAPALSAQPYLPGARDFEQVLPAVHRVDDVAARSAHGGEGPVTHLTRVIDAPARFDAVGLARELRPLELRAREEGGEWSAWLEIANGDPAWFGGADELQLRTRGWRPHGRLHYVNVSGDSTAAEGLLTDAREAVNGAVVAAAGLLSAEVAEAGPPKPDIVSRRAWGAELDRGGCEPRRKPSYGQMKAAVVHHTVGANRYTEADAPGIVLAICRYHRNALDWDDIGYNALVDRFGNIYAGRDGGLGRAVVGAHAQGVNAQTSGVAVMGTHTRKEPGRGTMRGLTRWLAWKLVEHSRTTEGRAKMVSAGGETSRYAEGDRFRMKRIVGHRRTNLTECPGDGMNRWLPKLRERVQGLIDRTAGSDDGGGGIGRSR